jgi:hypothetical protein
MWSSARAPITGIDDSGIVDFEEWRSCWTPESWRAALDWGVKEAMMKERIRVATHTGRPLGADGFAEVLEQVLHRPLVPRKSDAKPKWR